MRSTILAPALLLLAQGAPSLAQTTEGLMTIQTSVPSNIVSVPPEESDLPMSILPINITESITLPQETTGLTESPASDTGMMSIPAGETPITTGSSNSTNPTVTPSGSSSAPGSSSASGSAPPEQSTNAAVPGQTASDGTTAIFAVLLSGLSITFGFAWTLL